MRPSNCAAALVVFVLASCGPTAQKPKAPDRNAAPVSVGKAEPRWNLENSATAGTSLVHSDAAGQEVLRVVCRFNPPELYAAVPGINRVGSEDRLTVGAGAELAVFVVSMEGPDRGLRATGQPQPEFVAALAAGREIGVSYGSRQLMLPAPTREIGTTFAARCADVADRSDG